MHGELLQCIESSIDPSTMTDEEKDAAKEVIDHNLKLTCDYLDKCKADGCTGTALQEAIERKALAKQAAADAKAAIDAA